MPQSKLMRYAGLHVPVDQMQICHQPQSTYICRVQSCVCVFQNVDPPPPPSPPSECVLPPHQRRGVHTRRAVRGWGVNILEDAWHRIGLSHYNLSTPPTLEVIRIPNIRYRLRISFSLTFCGNDMTLKCSLLEAGHKVPAVVQKSVGGAQALPGP